MKSDYEYLIRKFLGPEASVNPKSIVLMSQYEQKTRIVKDPNTKKVKVLSAKNHVVAEQG